MVLLSVLAISQSACKAVSASMSIAGGLSRMPGLMRTSADTNAKMHMGKPSVLWLKR